MSGWGYLMLAGFFEICFTTCMKLVNGSYKSPWMFGFVISVVLGFYFLERSLAHIPMGTAYAVWTGIGAVGTILIGVLFFDDSLSIWRVLLLANIIFSIAGLKLLA